jgi:tubulin polyglutamylase TTLL6/13
MIERVNHITYRNTLRLVFVIATISAGSMFFIQRPPPKKPAGVTVNLEGTQYESVERCVVSLGFPIVTDDRNTVLFWYDNNVSVDFCLHLKPWQFVNHFPGTFSISNKVALARNIERMERVFPELYDFHPQSFTLPTHISSLQGVLAKGSGDVTYIVKPDLGAQGRGIFLVQDPESLSHYCEIAVAQKYISPYLIDGLKFDLRIYVLLGSVDPLRIYIFKDGMARFCTEPYCPPRPSNLDEVYRHLTNYSVNKHNERFRQNDKSEDGSEHSHKRSMYSVFRSIQRSGGDTAELQSEIDRIVVLTIMSALPLIRHNYRASFKADDGRSRCFEILGFDILVDENLKPWVLEVNHSPSLSCDSGFDIDLKDRVISGALRIADIPEDFMECCQHNEKEKTVQRISGSPLAGFSLGRPYSYERERKIARLTDWRPLFPVVNDPDRAALFEEVLTKVSEMPMGGMDETQTSSRRKMAIREQIQRIEHHGAPPQKKLASRPLKPLMFLRDVKRAQPAEDPKHKPGGLANVREEHQTLLSQVARNRIDRTRNDK